MRSFTTTDGVGIAYYDWAPEPGSSGDISGPPVIVHHGFAADTRLNWELPGVVGALVAANRRVVGLDARGHGMSDKPRNPALYGEDRMATDLVELLDVLGFDEIDLVGYSMGSIVSLIAATREPRIRRLAVGGVGSAAVELGGVDTRELDRRDLAEALRTDKPDEIENHAARGFRAFAQSNPQNDLLALAAQAEVVHQTHIHLERISAPTLVLAGRDDPLATRPEVLAGEISGARVELVEGDHFGALFSPEFTPLLVGHLA